MINLDYRKIIAIGFVLVVLGFALPLLMVTQVIPSSFAVNFFAYGASVAGLVLGTVGIAFYASNHRKKP